MDTKAVICVGVDSSWKESGALEWARQESLLRHEPLHAVHVVEEKMPVGPYFATPGTDETAKKLAADVGEYLNGHDGTIRHTTDVWPGPPAATLAKASAGSRMLVVGRRGAGTFARLLIGSTSEAVAYQADVPVVVVPDRWEPARADAPVVVGVDDAGHDDAAIEFAAATAAERHARLHLVHIWDIPNIYTWDAMANTGIYEEWAAQAEERMDFLADTWRGKHPELEIQTDLRRSHPVDGLLQAAEVIEAQLVVLGGRSRHRLTAVLLGSVARGVLHHATIPVAIVHEPPGQS